MIATQRCDVMNLSKRAGWIAVLGMAAVVSIAASASAKKLLGGLQDQDPSVPSGVRYTLGGNTLVARPTAYKSDGTKDCAFRISSNGSYLTTTSCTAAAVTYQARIETFETEALLCVSDGGARRAWNGPIVACNTGSMNLTRSDTGETKARIIGAIARGYN
jgi:hypothetical protein